jgi:amino acid transporter
VDGLIIGIASTAPAYSLAAVLAIVVVGVGVQAPAVLLASFIPMFLIASAFYYMNRADPDCGTSFSWVTRAMGPSLGWLGGWRWPRLEFSSSARSRRWRRTTSSTC